jgi:lipopolysaccharide biosynthesis protein
MNPCRLIAFYLPQYHPIPENDVWWGAGFTEWTNVRKALPLFNGHYQPRIPGELGWYDLRDPQVRQAQAQQAQAHGISAFCYYHYWFGGKMLLERPFNEILASGQPDFPFCLCWANESWNRSWDGRETQELIAQRYSAVDDAAHIAWLLPALSDSRYVRVDNKPLLLIYSATSLPDPSQTAALWRAQARLAGLDGLYLCLVESHRSRRVDPATLGFDAAVDFQPNVAALLTPYERLYWRLARRLKWKHGVLMIDYASWMQRALRQTEPAYRRFPCVTPAWDNTPRRKSGGFVLRRSTPTLYQQWLTAAIERARMSSSEPIVFINAWNEWAEGAYLEPDEKWGRGYLEATRSALAGQ